jgi:hypothetical protein
MNNNSRHRRRPNSRIDSERVRIFKCKWCKQPVTFSYGSTDREDKRVLTNVDGTQHTDNEIGGLFS